MITDPLAVLDFGGLLIHEPAKSRTYINPESAYPFMLAVRSEGVTFGDPERETVEIPSALLDGVIVTTTKFGNREVVFFVEVQSSSGEGLGRGERALMEQVNRCRGSLQRNSLSWLSPQAFGRETVYEVLDAHLGWEFDDDDEMTHRRVFRLELTCSSFGRGRDLVVTPAQDDSGVTPEFVMVDDGASLSGWSGTVGGSSATVTGPPPTVTPPVLRRNLVPNPRLLTTDSWGTGASGSHLTPVSGGMRIRVNGPAQTRLTMITKGAAAMSVTAGISYTARAVLSAPQQVASGARLKIRWWDASGDTISDSNGPALSANPTGTTAVTATAPAGAASAHWWFEGEYATPSINPYALITVSKPQFGPTDEDGAFFTGATETADGFAYKWQGLPDASISVQVPAGESTLTRTGTVTITEDLPFLHVDHTAPAGMTANLAGNDLTRIDSVDIGFGMRRDVFAADPVSASAVTFTALPFNDAAPGFSVLQVRTSNVEAGFAATGRYVSRTIDVRGTARAPASLSLSHPTTGLGDVTLYTCADDADSGYRPDLRRFRTSGGVISADPTAASGVRTTLAPGTPEVFDAPIGQYAEGVYEILAFVSHGGPSEVSRTLSWSASTRVDSTDYGVETGFRSVTIPPTFWATVSLGLVSLPAVPAADGSIHFELSANQAVNLDDVLLCNLTTGQLTRVNAGDHTRLWVDSPTLERPRRTIWLGDSADRSDARHAVGDEVQAWGAHQFMPGRVMAATKTDAISPGLALAQYEWFMHNASGYDDEDGEEG